MIPLMPSPGIPKIVSTPQSASREINTSEAIVSMTHLYHRTQYANIAHGNLFAIRARSPDLYPADLGVVVALLPHCARFVPTTTPRSRRKVPSCRTAGVELWDGHLGCHPRAPQRAPVHRQADRPGRPRTHPR